MSVADTRSILEQRLKLGWTRTPIFWQHTRFSPVEDVNHNPMPYIAFTLRNATSAEDITLGSYNPWYRFRGVIIISIYVPENSGSSLLMLYADLIKKIYLDPPRDFSYQNSGVIRLLVPQIVEVGTTAGWSQVNVIIPFHRDAQS